MSNLTPQQRQALMSNLGIALEEQLKNIEEYIRICEDEDLTNEQFFIKYEDELNRLSTLDHNKMS